MPPFGRMVRLARVMRLAVMVLSLATSGCALAEPLPPLTDPPPAGDARWGLAPGTVLAGDTTEFVALVTERGCASGRSSEGRVVGPDIEYTADAVIVTFGVRPQAGDCPSNPATAVPVTLDEPLGDRQLLDGGSDPPWEPPVCVRLDFCD